MSISQLPGSAERAALESLLAKSAGTDIPVLLQAKEVAKRLVKNDPSGSNLSALKRATSMLEAAMKENETLSVFENIGDVLRYLHEDLNRQIAKTKLYDDVKKGRLRKVSNTFRRRDVDRYASSLPIATTPDGRNREAEDRLRRKEEAEIRIKEATAEREELKSATLKGRYVLREYVDQELAARAMTFHGGLKSQFEAEALDLVKTVGGDPNLAKSLILALEVLVDTAAHEYARDLEFEVVLSDDGDFENLGETQLD